MRFTNSEDKNVLISVLDSIDMTNMEEVPFSNSNRQVNQDSGQPNHPHKSCSIDKNMTLDVNSSKRREVIKLPRFNIKSRDTTDNPLTSKMSIWQ